eukprot:SAG31_NODE_5979_length_2228_cov_1.962424_3_plen_61_part_00
MLRFAWAASLLLDLVGASTARKTTQNCPQTISGYEQDTVRASGAMPDGKVVAHATASLLW